MFGNLGPITKNLIILNVILFILTWFFGTKGINLEQLLGAHYFGTPLFQPYQIVSHFFMHGGILHIFMNMFVLAMFGTFLERIWGPKRYFMFYIASALGAFLLYNGVGYFQIVQLKQEIGNAYAIADLNGMIKEYGGLGYDQLNFIATKYQINDPVAQEALVNYYIKARIPMVGASGAIFGIMAAFALLFPNTELMLLFPPIPIKAKYLVGGYFLFEVYNSIYTSQGDSVAHLAHVGGAIVGGIIVLYWRKKGKNFW